MKHTLARRLAQWTLTNGPREAMRYVWRGRIADDVGYLVTDGQRLLCYTDRRNPPTEGPPIPVGLLKSLGPGDWSATDHALTSLAGAFMPIPSADLDGSFLTTVQERVPAPEPGGGLRLTIKTRYLFDLAQFAKTLGAQEIDLEISSGSNPVRDAITFRFSDNTDVARGLIMPMLRD